MITENQIESFFQGQLTSWADFAERYGNLSKCEYRTIKINGNDVLLQHNPARAISTNAKVDKASIVNRKCFLCTENRPAEQSGMSIAENFTLLVNPYPILDRHFTIVCNEHKPQSIKDCFSEMLDIAKIMQNYMVFYNGPQCGASAPDHLHLQAVRKGQLPLEEQWKSIEKVVLSEWKSNKMEQLKGYGRCCFHIESEQKSAIISLFNQISTQYQMMSGIKDESKLNMFAMCEGEVWHVFVFFRKEHRPKQYYAEDDTHRLVSPGAIDMAGIIVLPRKEDFDNITFKEVEDIYRQVSM